MVPTAQWRTLAILTLGLTLALCGLCAAASAQQQKTEDVDQPLKTSATNPNAVAMVIGIADYQDSSIPKVEFAVNDANAVQRVLVQTMGYTQGRILSSTNSQASIGRMKSSIRQGLAGLVRPGVSDVFLYYSGHGAPNPDTREGYLIPWDFDSNYPPTSESAYSLKDLYTDLGKLGARSVTVVLEACFSGATDTGKTLIKDASPLSIENSNPANLLSNGVVIAAGGRSEIASWYRERNHGLMTYYWLRALQGEVGDAQGNVTADGIKKYLGDNVPAMARELKSRTQNPEVYASAGNQTLAVVPVSALVSGGANLVKTYGSLRVSIDVGGDLYIDGIRQGTIQAGAAFVQPQIATGPHSLEVRKDGYTAQRAETLISEGQQMAQNFYLARILPNAPQIIQQFGLIAVTVDRGGSLFIDDKKVDDLRPFAIYNSAQIEAGPHRLRVELPGFISENQEVMVPPNQTASLNISLRAVPAPASAVAAPAAIQPAPVPVSTPVTAPVSVPTPDRPSVPSAPPATLASGPGMEFVRIPAGTFTMGCSPRDGQCFEDNKPAHSVTISKAFDLGKYEVTQAQYQTVMGTNPSRVKGDSLPVEMVSWSDAQEFLKRMNAREDGYRYRLPTEAEWEYAARAGTTGTTPGTLDAIGWYDQNSGGRSHPVGQKQPNAWGAYDMIGNVLEWVEDRYGDKYYQSAAAQTDPKGPASGNNRILRGGSWYSVSRIAPVSNRVSNGPAYRNYYVGFRVVREAISQAQ